MKKIYLTILCFSLPLFLLAQGNSSADEIQHSGRYLFGIGQGSSFLRADNNALDHLITQITVQVESLFVDKITEEEGDIKNFAESVVNTYSNVSLTSARSLLIEEHRGNFTVMRYISLRDMDQVFENRRNKILSYVKSARMAEADLRIGDALKNYYWALALLRSHKDRDVISYDFQNQGEQLLIMAIPERIDNIFSDLDFEKQAVELKPQEKYKAVYLKVTYNGKDVDNLDFVYWLGTAYSNPVSVRSGIALIEFYGDSFDQLSSVKINVEYKYANKANFDLEVNEVFKNIDIPYNSRCEFIVPLKQTLLAEPRLTSLEIDKIDFEKLNEVEHSRKIRKDVVKVVEAIQSGDGQSVQSNFTAEGWQMYNALIANGNVKVLPFVDTLDLIRLDNKTVVRSVPMRFSFQNNSRNFIEQVVFTFDENRKIDALSFAISDKAISDIVSRSNRFGSVADKYQLIGFLEHYKTAYCLKRIDHIESIFADNALIIVGHVLRPAEAIDGMYAMAGREQLEYIELSKTEYIDRLRRVFNSNEFVNIHFEENIVKKVNGESKIYGIQIKQDYFSATYADKGYLFLMIDLNDSLNPKIYVRTWQPERNADGSIFGLDDFFVN